MKIAPEELAKKFHDVYEGFAPAHNYKTNNETKVFNPDSANGKLMIATCKSILEWLDESEGLTEAALKDATEHSRILFEKVQSLEAELGKANKYCNHLEENWTCQKSIDRIKELEKENRSLKEERERISKKLDLLIEKVKTLNL